MHYLELLRVLFSRGASIRELVVQATQPFGTSKDLLQRRRLRVRVILGRERQATEQRLHVLDLLHRVVALFLELSQIGSDALLFNVTLRRTRLSQCVEIAQIRLVLRDTHLPLSLRRLKRRLQTLQTEVGTKLTRRFRRLLRGLPILGGVLSRSHLLTVAVLTRRFLLLLRRLSELLRLLSLLRRLPKPVLT